MKKTWAYVYLFASLLAASISNASQYQNVKDLRESESKLAGRIASATFGFRTTNLNGLQCTAFFVGSQGEALTNLHCVEQCLLDARIPHEELAYLEPVFVSPENPSNRQYIKKMLVSIDPDHPVTCHAKIVFNGNEFDGDVQIYHVFGPGFLYPKTLISDLSRLDLPFRNSLLNLGFEGSGDLVLIKVSSQKESACLKIASANFSSQTPVLLNLAYTQVLRETGDPKNPYQVIGDGRKNPVASVGNGTSSKKLLRLDDTTYSFAIPTGTLLTSTDAEIGASGSPLVNENGEVVAVARATYASSGSVFKPWTTHAIDLSFHLEALKKLPNGLKLCQ